MPSRTPLRILAAALAVCAAGQAGADPSWSVDPGLSRLAFSVGIGRHEAQGHFDDWTAEIRFDPDTPETATVRVVVDTASVSIDAAQARGPILGRDWLDVTTHGTAVFTGSGIDWRPDGSFSLPGALLLAGVTRPVELAGTLAVDGARATATVHLTLARLAFGVGSPDPAVSGSVSVTATVIAERGE